MPGSDASNEMKRYHTMWGSLVGADEATSGAGLATASAVATVLATPGLPRNILREVRSVGKKVDDAYGGGCAAQDKMNQVEFVKLACLPLLTAV